MLQPIDDVQTLHDDVRGSTHAVPETHSNVCVRCASFGSNARGGQLPLHVGIVAAERLVTKTCRVPDVRERVSGGTKRKQGCVHAVSISKRSCGQ